MLEELKGLDYPQEVSVVDFGKREARSATNFGF
jgi:hypothetical protein